MTLEEATKAGIARLRKPYWALPEDVLVLDLLGNGFRGPWATLYSPLLPPEGERILLLGDTAEDWEQAGASTPAPDPV